MAKQRSLLSVFGTDTTEAVDEAVDEPEDMQVAESETCECQACCDPNTPHQLLNVSNSRTTHMTVKREKKVLEHSRTIQQSWIVLVTRG